MEGEYLQTSVAQHGRVRRPLLHLVFHVQICPGRRTETVSSIAFHTFNRESY